MYQIVYLTEFMHLILLTIRSTNVHAEWHCVNAIDKRALCSRIHRFVEWKMFSWPESFYGEKWDDNIGVMQRRNEMFVWFVVKFYVTIVFDDLWFRLFCLLFFSHFLFRLFTCHISSYYCNNNQTIALINLIIYTLDRIHSLIIGIHTYTQTDFQSDIIGITFLLSNRSMCVCVWLSLPTVSFMIEDFIYIAFIIRWNQKTNFLHKLKWLANNSGMVRNFMFYREAFKKIFIERAKITYILSTLSGWKRIKV